MLYSEGLAVQGIQGLCNVLWDLKSGMKIYRDTTGSYAVSITALEVMTLGLGRQVDVVSILEQAGGYEVVIQQKYKSMQKYKVTQLDSIVSNLLRKKPLGSFKINRTAEACVQYIYVYAEIKEGDIL